MSSDNPITDVAEGATKGALNFGLEKINELAKKLASRELAFIEDEETIQTVKTQRGLPEWKLYSNYVQNRDLRIQIQAGLALRKFEGDQRRQDDLKDKLFRKYGKAGLHVAELVQVGSLSQYVAILLGESPTNNELSEGVEEILKDIEKYVAFIKKDDNVKERIQTLVARIRANNPRGIAIFSRNKNCASKARKIILALKKQIVGYEFRESFDEEKYQRHDFIVRKQ